MTNDDVEMLLFAERDSGTYLLNPAYGAPGGRSRLTRWAPMTAAAVIAGIAIAVTGLAACARNAQGPTAPGSSASVSNPPATTASSAPARVAACLASQLTASIARRGSTASAPFLIVALRNTATEPCTLSGYPGIAVYAAASTAPVPIAIQHGTYEQADPGPHPVRLPAGGQASFALGTSTAYSGGTNVTITKITIRLPGRHTTAIRLDIPGGLGATSNRGAPVPVGITAFAAATPNR